ncbi:hypothetical protein [Verrucosispora sp. NA02020]|uniref:hypothetical protein n=1 Tax=Verrucosispora sp. NA02020 TaxID=2742132 RepID=UPI003D740639
MDEYGGTSVLGDGVDVVVLREENGRTVPVAGVRPIDLADGQAPDPESLSELLDSTVRLTTVEGTPATVLDALRAIPGPATFAASPWLIDSRPIVVRDGVGTVGAWAVHYSDAIGLRVISPV